MHLIKYIEWINPSLHDNFGGFLITLWMTSVKPWWQHWNIVHSKMIHFTELFSIFM